MLLLLFFLLSRRTETCALPILSPSFSETSTQNPSFDVTTTASTGAIAGRTLWGILWSCLATTFTCTWVSVHPNVPFLTERKTRSWRVYLTLVSLFAPEIMILWASKQFYGALVIMKTVNSSYWVQVHEKDCVDPETKTKTVSQDADKIRKAEKELKQTERDNSPLWTLTHAQYLQMGGYRLQCLTSEEKLIPSRYGRHAKAMFAGGERDVWELPLSFETMKAAFNKGQIDIPFIRKDEILEKNGRDALSRTIAMLQLAWFIIQIVARIRQNLAVTELELTTAVLASLNIVMYVLWWSKPTDIQHPTIIRTKGLQDQDLRWMHNVSLPSPTRDDSPPPDLVMHYVIEQVGDTEMVNLATSLKFIVEFPAKLVTGGLGLPSELGALIRRKWADMNSVTDDPPSKASETTKCTSFTAKVRKTISLIWRTVTHLFQPLVYYPTLATLGSGRRSKRRSRCNTDPGEKHIHITAEDVEDRTTIQLIFDKHAIRFVLDMVFFCEDTANAPFAFLSAFSGAIFGMSHCLAWNFEFPSHVEQILWRTSSSIIAGLYVCIMVTAFGFISFKSLYHRATPLASEDNPSVGKPAYPSVRRRTFDINFDSEIARGVLSACFVLTRLSLLTLSITQLRSLPASAYDTVEWSGFIPHI